MGVYIKGLEIPKENVWIVEVKFHITDDTGIYSIVEDVEPAQVVEIPTPHGRLIDRDAVPEVSADPFEEAAFQDVLDDMPVIIEAEGRS